MHGFKDAEDYYTRSSSKGFLKHIQTPTLILHAADDPFMTPEVVPKAEDLSLSVCLELSEQGGHVGFIHGTPTKPQYWLEERIPEYLDED